MPNSRVRALTENAKYARDANHGNQQRDHCEHAKDQGVQAVWSKHFCPDIFERGRVLNGFIGGHLADNLGYRRHQRIRICGGVDEEVTAENWASAKLS